jgi:hypothetical protein
MLAGQDIVEHLSDEAQGIHLVVMSAGRKAQEL